jgi:hypothetical protein
MPGKRGRSIKLGPLTTIAEIEDGLRIAAKKLAADGDLVSASRNMAVLASIKLRAKELELKGLNVRTEEGEQITLTLNEYREPYVQEKARADLLAEENAALQARIDAIRPAVDRENASTTTRTV